MIQISSTSIQVRKVVELFFNSKIREQTREQYCTNLTYIFDQSAKFGSLRFANQASFG